MHISQARDTYSPDGVEGRFSTLVNATYDETSASEILAEPRRHRRSSAVSNTGPVELEELAFRFFLTGWSLADVAGSRDVLVDEALLELRGTIVVSCRPLELMWRMAGVAGPPLRASVSDICFSRCLLMHPLHESMPACFGHE